MIDNESQQSLTHFRVPTICSWSADRSLPFESPNKLLLHTYLTAQTSVHTMSAGRTRSSKKARSNLVPVSTLSALPAHDLDSGPGPVQKVTLRLKPVNTASKAAADPVMRESSIYRSLSRQVQTESYPSPAPPIARKRAHSDGAATAPSTENPSGPVAKKTKRRGQPKGPTLHTTCKPVVRPTDQSLNSPVRRVSHTSDRAHTSGSVHQSTSESAA